MLFQMKKKKRLHIFGTVSACSFGGNEAPATRTVNKKKVKVFIIFRRFLYKSIHSHRFKPNGETLTGRQ